MKEWMNEWGGGGRHAACRQRTCCRSCHVPHAALSPRRLPLIVTDCRCEPWSPPGFTWWRPRSQYIGPQRQLRAARTRMMTIASSARDEEGGASVKVNEKRTCRHRAKGTCQPGKACHGHRLYQLVTTDAAQPASAHQPEHPDQHGGDAGRESEAVEGPAPLRGLLLPRSAHVLQGRGRMWYGRNSGGTWMRERPQAKGIRWL